MSAKQKGLGRGLDALLADQPYRREAIAMAREGVAPSPPEASGRRMQTLPVAFLSPNPEQPRRVFDEAALDELAASLKTRGMLQPILVRPTKVENAYEIVAGERRWRAAQMAGLHDVPVVIRELNDFEVAEIALVENVQRVDLNPMEEAAAYGRLADFFHRTQEQIAEAVGKSRSHVSNMMRLLALPERARGALADGAITIGHARALLTVKRPDEALDAVLKHGLSVRKTEALVRRLNEEHGRKGEAPPAKGPSKPSVPGASSADVRALENDLSAALGLNVGIKANPNGSGFVAIAYSTLEQLDEVTRRLMGTGV